MVSLHLLAVFLELLEGISESGCAMSTINQAEASKPFQQKKMQEYIRCENAGYSNQMIGFEKKG
jgi:hypothetical protein